MIRVFIEYYVVDKKDRQFRHVTDIAKDVEREIWESPLFSEATDYQIVVINETESSIIKYKEEKKDEKNFMM